MTSPRDNFYVLFWVHDSPSPSARPYRTYFDALTGLPTAYPLSAIRSSPLWQSAPEVKTLQDIVQYLPDSSRKAPLIISTKRAAKLLGWTEFFYPGLYY